MQLAKTPASLAHLLREYMSNKGETDCSVEFGKINNDSQRIPQEIHLRAGNRRIKFIVDGCLSLGQIIKYRNIRRSTDTFSIKIERTSDYVFTSRVLELSWGSNMSRILVCARATQIENEPLQYVLIPGYRGSLLDMTKFGTVGVMDVLHIMNAVRHQLSVYDLREMVVFPTPENIYYHRSRAGVLTASLLHTRGQKYMKWVIPQGSDTSTWKPFPSKSSLDACLGMCASYMLNPSEFKRLEDRFCWSELELLVTNQPLTYEHYTSFMRHNTNVVKRALDEYGGGIYTILIDAMNSAISHYNEHCSIFSWYKNLYQNKPNMSHLGGICLLQ